MIFHVVPLDDWLVGPDRPYAPRSLAEEGFVHCSPDEESALAVADAFYRDAVGPLMVLLIDEDALDARVRWEPPTGGPPPGVPEGTLFPHVYGRINRTAVAGMLEVEREADGHAVALSLWS
ncbi:DUF952 domain-containing protein [Streptomyces sp. NPDC059506]|uniref:DUF952 domain-containing protein n=1 Tax=Streptomyces thermolineatus TaxID=44033 RepID=A0ABN3MCI0_9ACTN|nr:MULTISPECIES: DUF952 domain-containing protein [unclassified Streptomyces]MCZ2527461.1 DUF952 domain-containing protein [Streptomyces sp. HB2AG]PLW65612.1 DUF952 domain-containing protein [Streptomyces sp. DJ]QMV24051.1 DUF952 domain-containing protein [Streptomyces sp. SCUT-3]